MGFLKKKKRKNFHFKIILFQDKLEINEENISFFQRKLFQNFHEVAWVFKKKKLLEFPRFGAFKTCLNFKIII